MSFNLQSLLAMMICMKIWLKFLGILKIWKMRYFFKFLNSNVFHPEFLFVSMLFQVKSFLLLNMYLHVAWCLQSIDGENPSETSLTALMSKRTMLIEQLHYFTNTIPEVQKEGRGRNVLSSRVSHDVYP